MVNVNETTNVEVKKRKGRGISNETRTVSLLKFHEKDAATNGLFVGHLEEVTVDYRTLADDVKGLQSFAGQAVPRITFHFTSNHKDEQERRHVFQTLLPAESNVNTIPGGSDAWQVDNVLSWIKHMLDIYYLKGRQLTEEEEDALTLPFEDFDEKGEYVPVEAEDVLKGYAQVFNNAAAMMNGAFNLKDGETAKPCYRDDKGGYKSCWMKLLRYTKSRNKGWTAVANGNLAFSSFIGEGCVELVKGANPPAILRIDVTRESITPKETKKAPNIPGVGGVMNPMGNGVNIGGVQIPNVAPMADGNNFDNSAFAAAGEDLPF